MFRGPNSLASDRRDRTDVDDVAARSAEVLGRFLRRENQAQHVKVEHFVKVLGRHVLQRCKLVDAGVVDQDVELAAGLRGLGEKPTDIRFFRDVGLHRDGLAAFAGDFGDDAVGTFLAGGVVDDHRRPFVCQMFGNSGTNPLRTARYNSDFTCQFFSVVTMTSILSLMRSLCQCGQRFDYNL